MKFTGKLSVAVMVMAMSLTTVGAMAADYEGLPGVKKNYIGVTAGADINTRDNPSFGAVAGHNLNDFVAVEAQYEYRHNDSHLATGNVLVGPQLGAVKPYVLAGAGYKWTENDGDYSVWVAGAGAKVALNEDVDLDARYRYIKGSDREKEERVTLGVNFKF